MHKIQTGELALNLSVLMVQIPGPLEVDHIRQLHLVSVTYWISSSFKYEWTALCEST